MFSLIVSWVQALLNAGDDDQNGQGLVEYALILVLVAVVVIVVLAIAGGGIKNSLYGNILAAI